MAHQPARREGVLAADTIVAAATAAGRGAIGIVRISGPEATRIAGNICGRLPAPRHAEHRRLRSTAGETIDSGVVLFFPAPASFTGEDVVELQCHGSPVIIDWLLETACADGARLARPGEFSLRAFLNDKFDLTQAEAIADLIGSGSRAAARAAARSLTGQFSLRVAELQARLSKLRVLAESWLDFPDEDIDHAAVAELEAHWRELSGSMQSVLNDAVHGRQLTDGLQVAIAGRPNAGKSSLFNRLAGEDAAIVTEQAGTTRDTLRHTVNLGGVSVSLVDMAGLRQAADAIEREGVRRAESEIAAADHVLWVADVGAGIEAAEVDAHRALPAGKDRSLVLNKIDTIAGEPHRFDAGCPVIALSAKTGAGVDLLAGHLRELAGIDEPGTGAFSARRRHVEALAAAAERIAAAGPRLAGQLELAAEELRLAQSHLDELTGEHTSDDLLGEIFSTFCIGK